MKVLITGTSSGIGEALALEYVGEGTEVWGFSRRPNHALSKHSNFHFYSCDFSQNHQVEFIFQKIFSNHEHFDLVILNAGILGEIKPLKSQQTNEIERMMQVNVWANKTIIDSALNSECTINQIVAISSGASKHGSAGWGPYAISKAALNMLIEVYASENQHIHFSNIAPGLVETAMQDYISSISDDADFPTIQRLKKAKGTDQMPNPGQIAPKLMRMFQQVKSQTSGQFFDIRHS